MSVSRRLATVPWPVHVLLTLVPGVVTLGLLSFVYADLDQPALLVVGGVVFAVAAVVGPVVAAVRRRRLQAEGRWEARLDAVDAFGQRRVPGDPAVRAELAEVTARNRASLGPIRWGPVLFGVLAVTSVLSALDEPRKWVMVAFFGGLAVAYPLLYRRVRGQVEAAERGLGSPV